MCCLWQAAAAGAIALGHDCWGSALFCLALNHKQMSMYVAPAFFAHLLGKCRQQPSLQQKVNMQDLSLVWSSHKWCTVNLSQPSWTSAIVCTPMPENAPLAHDCCVAATALTQHGCTLLASPFLEIALLHDAKAELSVQQWMHGMLSTQSGKPLLRTHVRMPHTAPSVESAPNARKYHSCCSQEYQGPILQKRWLLSSTWLA